MNFDEAIRWSKAGFGIQDAFQWKDSGFGPEEAKQKRAAGLKPFEAEKERDAALQRSGDTSRFGTAPKGTCRLRAAGSTGESIC
jgi:hypothetical protein